MTSGRRRGLSRLLAGVATAAVLVGCLAAYANHSLFNSRAFANRAVSVLDDDAVKAQIGEAITDAGVEQVPNAVAARPLIASVATGLVGAQPVQSLLMQAVEDLHRTIVRGHRDTFTVSLENVGVLLRSALQTASPKLADQISKQLDVPLLTPSEEGTTFGIVVDATRIERDLRSLQWIALGVALLAAIGSIALAATRIIGLRRLGRALAGGGAIALIAWFAGRAILVSGFDGQTRDVVNAIFNAFAGDLRTWLAVLAGLGLVLTAAASTSREPIDAGALLRRGWVRVATTPTSGAGRVGRALALLIVGVWGIANRDLLLDALAWWLSAFVIYVGAAELMRMAAGVVRSDSSTEAAREEAIEADLSGGALARIGLAAAVLVGAFVAVGFATNKDENPPLHVNTCNGYVELCDRPLNEVAFAGTHNSMSSATYHDWFFAQQEKGIRQQLDDGIRALLIDPHYGVRTPKGVATDLSADEGSRKKIEQGVGSDGVKAAEALRAQIGFEEGQGKREIFLCHAFCELGAIPISQGLGELRDFLVANPGEVVLLSIEDATSPEETTAALEGAGLGPYIYKGPNGPPWPTLRELIDSDQRLVVMAERQGGEPPWYRRQFQITQETPYHFTKPEELSRPSSCKPNRGRSDADFFLLNHWVDTSPAPQPTNAEQVNSRKVLERRIAMCTRIRGIEPNIVAVDFYREGDLFGVVNDLNGVGAGAAPQRPKGAAQPSS